MPHVADLPVATPRVIGLLEREHLPALFETVRVRPDGVVARLRRERLSFGFTFEGAGFTAEGRCDDAAVTIDLKAILGPLPFSAQSAAARRAILDLVAHEDAHPQPRIALGRGHMLEVTGRVCATAPHSPVGVLTAVIAALLPLRPRLQRLAALLSTMEQAPVSA